VEKIYKILADLRSEFDFHSSNDFFADGMLDSFDVISLVNILEEDFEILIDALDIIPENFCNTEAIANVVVKNGGNV
jgi:acyl carrier protein